MKIAIGSDESSYLTDYAIADLLRRGHDLVLVGALTENGDARWPIVGFEVGRYVASKECAEGVLFCFTGTGVSIAANKIPGIRAALCTDAQTASGAKQYNHANILAMSLRSTSTEEAKEIFDAWFNTSPGEDEDREYVELLVEGEYNRSGGESCLL